MRTVVLFSLLFTFVCTAPTTVYVVPHSHDDAGWLWTVDEYFDQQVKFILDSVTETLINNPTFPFHQVEQIYFNRWWKQASAKQQAQFRTLYNRGQIEFLNGGWVMHDDAITTYNAMVDQTTLGHQFINDIFGPGALPKIGWTVDPFGMSTVTAKFNKACKMDYHGIVRISFEVKEKMIKDSNLNFLWRFDPAHDDADHQIFTHVLYDGYATYGKLDWDVYGNISVTDENVKSFADRVRQAVDRWKVAYKSEADHIMFALGNDFDHQHAQRNYYNMSKVMDYINKNSASYNMTIKFAKLSEYLKAVYPIDPHATSNYSYDTIYGDFFPYADIIYSFWTGYFVSRAELKNKARQSERISREGEVLFALARTYGTNITYNDNYEKLYALRNANGLVQHHDGITGTSRIHVVKNYMDYLTNGIATANIAISNALIRMMSQKGTAETSLTLRSVFDSDLLNLSSGDIIPVIVYNSLGWNRQGTIRIVINKPSVKVTYYNGSSVQSQVRALGSGRYELLFTTHYTISALGYSLYFIKVNADQSVQSTTSKMLKDSIVSNKIYDISFDKNGNINKIRNNRDNVEINLSRQVMMYDSETTSPSSGAYVFRSAGPEAIAVNATSAPVHIEGDVAHVITQTFAPYFKETLKLYKTDDEDATSEFGEANVIEFNFVVGPLPENKEAIVRFNTNIKNNREITTDNNGLVSLRRKYRDWPNNPAQKLFPTASNYYPLTYHASIEDNEYQLIVVTNTSRGVASLKDGAIEVMLHRRSMVNDGKGPDIVHNDVEVVGIQLRLIFSKTKSTSVVRAHQAHRANFPLDPFIFNNFDQHMLANLSRLFYGSISPLQNPLPNNIHLLTFAQQNVQGHENTLIRAINLEQQDPEITTYDFNTAFSLLKADEQKETTLTGVVPEGMSDFKAALGPLQIRTYLATLSRKN